MVAGAGRVAGETENVMDAQRGRAPSLITEAFWSVTFTASTDAKELRRARFWSMLTPFGGVISAVMRKGLDSSFSRKLAKGASL